MSTGGRFLGTMAAVVAASCFALGQPAQAQRQDFVDLIKNAAGIATGGGNVDARQADIESRITVGLRTGQLTVSEASELRAELGRIGNLENQFMADGQLNMTESRALMRDLNMLGARIDGYMGTPGGAPPVASAEVDVRQAQLEEKVSSGQRSGQLTRIEAQALRNELKHVSDMEENFKADGALTNGEIRSLLSELDELNSHITLQIRDRDVVTTGPVDYPSVNERQAEIERGIERGIRSGRLTAAEAAEIRVEFDRLAVLEAQYRASGRLSSYERRTLNNALSNLMAKLRFEVRDEDTASNDIDEKQTRLANRITRLESTAALTAHEAAQLRSELEFIAEAEAYFKRSGGVLTQVERQRLLADLDRLGTRIDRLAMNQPGPSSSAAFDAKQAQLLTRIVRGEDTGRLTRQEANALRRTFNQIASMEAAMKADGRLTSRELVRLNADLDNLENVVWQQMTDRQYAGDRYRRFF